MQKKEAVKLLRKYGVSEEKIIHSINVANIAKFIAEKLNQKGLGLNVDLVYVGALLHDIGYFKGATEEDRINHSKVGADILKKEGFGKYSDIVLRHDIKGWVFENLRPITWEEKILNYCDKRESAGAGIITLKEREEIFLKFMPNGKQWITKAFKEVGKFEKELFEMIKMKPEDLKKFVKEE